MTPDQSDLIAEIRAHALRHYELGWDVLVECMDDEEILEEIGGEATLDTALRALAMHLHIPREVSGRYVLIVAAEDGQHFQGHDTYASAIAAWMDQSGYPWDMSASRAWEEHGRVSTSDDYGRRITLIYNPRT